MIVFYVSVSFVNMVLCVCLLVSMSFSVCVEMDLKEICVSMRRIFVSFVNFVCMGVFVRVFVVFVFLVFLVYVVNKVLDMV